MTLFIMLIMLTAGQPQAVGFDDIASCQIARAELVKNPNVKLISECSEIILYTPRPQTTNQ